MACFFLIASLTSYYTIISIGPKHSHCSKPFFSNLFLICYSSGYFGSRLASIIFEENPHNFSEVTSLLFSIGPMTFYGGFIFAILTGGSYVYINRVPIESIFNIAIPIGMIALGIGRIGCFLNGDDFGIPVPSDFYEKPPFWAVKFPNHPVPIPRVPVQLIECFFGLAIGMIGLRRLPEENGINILCTYALFRFFIEFLRGDDRGQFISPLLSPSQWISISIICIACLLFLARKYANFLKHREKR